MSFRLNRFKSRLLISTPGFLSQMMESSSIQNSLPSSILLTFCHVSSLVDFSASTYHTCASFYLSLVPAPWIEPPHPQPRRWLRPPLATSTLSPSSSWWGQLSVGGFPLSSLQSLLPHLAATACRVQPQGHTWGHCPCSRCSSLTGLLSISGTCLTPPYNPPTPSPVCLDHFLLLLPSFNSCLSLEFSSNITLLGRCLPGCEACLSDTFTAPPNVSLEGLITIVIKSRLGKLLLSGSQLGCGLCEAGAHTHLAHRSVCIPTDAGDSVDVCWVRERRESSGRHIPTLVFEILPHICSQPFTSGTNVQTRELYSGEGMPLPGDGVPQATWWLHGLF